MELNLYAKFTDVNYRFSALYSLKNKASVSVLDSFMQFEKDLGLSFNKRV